MTDGAILRVAIWREIYSRRKAYLVSTAMILVLVVGGIAVAALVTDADEEGVDRVAVGVLEPDAVLAARLRAGADEGIAVQVVRYADRTQGEEALRAGRASALVVSLNEVVWAPGISGSVMDTVTSAMAVARVHGLAADFDLPPDAVSRLLAPTTGEFLATETVDKSVELLAVVTVILMFLGIIAYGQWIAYGVVEEKVNRVAEVVLGAVTPRMLLAAKMISLGGMGLLQMLVVGTAGLITVQIAVDVEMPSVAAGTFAWLAVWFLLGYTFYALLYAAAGSLAADTQEAGSYIGPLNLLPGIGYAVGLIAFSSGSEMLPRVLSLIPVWTPLLMPGRMAQEIAAPWEVAVAVAVMLTAIFVMFRLAARVYLGGLTQATRSLGWREAFRSGRDFDLGTAPQ